MSLSWAEELMGYIEETSVLGYEGGFESELCRGFQIRDSRGKLVKPDPLDFTIDALDEERAEKWQD